MTNKKLQEIAEQDIRTGKYLAVGKPIVLEINNDVDNANLFREKSREDEESKFQKSLEEVIGTVKVPYDAEFFLRGYDTVWSEIGKDDEGRTCYISKDYVPVQFYATAKFTVNVSSEVRSRIGNVSDRDCDRRATGISNAD